MAAHPFWVGAIRGFPDPIREAGHPPAHLLTDHTWPAPCTAPPSRFMIGRGVANRRGTPALIMKREGGAVHGAGQVWSVSSGPAGVELRVLGSGSDAMAPTEG